MADENKEEKVLELDQAGLEALIDERAEAKATAKLEELQASQDADRQAEKDELARLRARDHQRSVAEHLAKFKVKHSPALLKTAQEIMLADDAQSTMLELSIEGQDDPQKLSATDIVLSLLESVPDTILLGKGDPVPRIEGQDPLDQEEEKDVEERAENLLTELKRDAVRIG